MTRGVALALGLVACAAGACRGPRMSAGRDDGTRLELAPAPAPAHAPFARALAPRPFLLPQDHGPHFEFQSEWWYYTGQVASPDGRRFGFQVTFFRRGLSPGAPDGPGLATNQIYFAHLAVTDVAAGRHRFFERFARGAGGLAGARGEDWRVWLEDWSAEGLNADASRLRLRARAEGVALDLTLEATKPLVAHGEDGLSAKSGEPGNASYYIGYTRLAATGTLAAGAPPVEVAGEAWFDHEWSTSALGPRVRGWDWFSLQLDDGWELMFYALRREDGTREPASGGTLVAPDGRTQRLSADDVEITPRQAWASSETGATYPTRWRLRLPRAGLELEVRALLDAQEMRTSFVYWEGAVSVGGTHGERPLQGHGYVELTGYARSLQGVF